MSERVYLSGDTDHEESGVEKTKKRKLVIVDTGDSIEQQARDMAEERLVEDKNELTGAKGFFKKIWKHNLAREYYRQKEISLARQRILETGNLYSDEEASENAHQQAMSAVLDRFASELKDEDVIHTGESRSTYDEKDTVLEGSLVSNVKELVLEYINDKHNTFTDEAFAEEKRRITALHSGTDEKVSNVRFADNLLEIAKELKEKFEHDITMEELDKEVEIVYGEARLGVRTEAQYNNFDKVTEYIRNSFVGRFVDETTIASAVAIAGSVIGKVSQSAARSKVLAWGTFGMSALLGAGFSAMRESHKVEDERRQHSRMMAKGGKSIKNGSERREEMEKVRYETVHAGDIADQILENIKNIDSPDAFNNAMCLLLQAESRIQISDNHDLDLLSYTDSKSVEQERLKLDISRAQAKVILRDAYESGILDTSAGSAPMSGSRNFDEFFDSALESRNGAFMTGESGIEQKNKMFSLMKRRRVASAALKGLASGLIIGAGVQEIVAIASDDQQGLLERGVESLTGNETNDNEPNATVLEALREYIAGRAIDDSLVEQHIDVLPGKELIEFPDGITLEPIPGGTPSVYRFSIDGEALPYPVKFEGGQLDQASVDMLREHGVLVRTGTTMLPEVDLEKSGISENLSSEQYVENNPDVFKRIHRDGWYDNDTVRADKNELKLGWGGHHKSGIDADGNFVYSIAGMKAGGSHHGELSVDIKNALAQGKLKLLLSLSRDTQFNPVEVPIDANGNAIIDPNSEIAKTFFKTVDTKDGPQLKFIGKFAEVGHSQGAGTDGLEHFRIMATDEGKGLSTVKSLVGTRSKFISFNPDSMPVPQTVTRFDLLEPERNMVPPPFIPVFGRQPLERLENKKPIAIPSDYFMYGSGVEGGELEMIDRTRKTWLSKTLQENPSAELDEKKEIDDYLNSNEKDHVDLLKKMAADAGPMNEKCRLAVCIPVAGHQEGESIYNSLESYTKQTADKDSFELVLFVNHPDRDKLGVEVKPDDTLKEIERFKKDYPDMNVRLMYEIVPRERAKIGYVRKLLNDAVLVRQRDRGEDAPELSLVSNDADNKGIAPEYISNFIEKFDTDKSVDSYMGQLDFDPDSYIRKPLLHVGIRFFQYLEVQSRFKKYNINSSGANFAMRAKSYAAVGGYSNSSIGEDSIMGARLKTSRKDAADRTAIAYGGPKKSRLYTSSRRAEATLREGKAPIEMWDSGFSATDNNVRKVNWDESKAEVDFDNPEAVREFTAQIQDVINRSIKRMDVWGTKSGDPTVKKTLGWLGIKYRTVGDSGIEILDASKLIEGLKEYKNIGGELHKRKSGKGETSTVAPALASTPDEPAVAA